MTKARRAQLLALQDRIGHHFGRLELLDRALTHSSHANEGLAPGGGHNEALEFLGDAVLGCVVADILHRQGRDDEALVEYARAREADPELPTAWCGEGVIRLESEDPALRDRAEAARLLTRAVLLRPDDAEYRELLARALAPE